MVEKVTVDEEWFKSLINWRRYVPGPLDLSGHKQSSHWSGPI